MLLAMVSSIVVSAFSMFDMTLIKTLSWFILGLELVRRHGIIGHVGRGRHLIDLVQAVLDALANLLGRAAN